MPPAKHNLLFLILLYFFCDSGLAEPDPFPNQISIRAEHMGWSSASTNLTLSLSNGVYVAGTFAVAPELVSNLVTAARQPWPAPDTNAYPRFKIDPPNLGLNADWLKTNYQRLLEAYSGKGETGVFPNASLRQRAWLTNALADLELLGEAVRGAFGGFWTDDYPTLEVRLERDDGQSIEQLLRLFTRAQQSFMLPWEVHEGTNQTISANAEISRAVAALLPTGFLLRDRVSGDLFQLVSGEFPRLRRVHEFLKQSVLEESLGEDGQRLLEGFELENLWIPPGSYARFPDNFRANLRARDWPKGIIMPISTGIERGEATELKRILTNANSRVAPLLKQDWLIARLKEGTEKKLSLEVKPEGAPGHQWLRGHMANVGLGAFYDAIQPELHRGLGFVLREGLRRSSEWALLPDGRTLLYGFTGDGVLDWKPEELGFRGDARMLKSFNINRVGVFVGKDGKSRKSRCRKRSSLGWTGQEGLDKNRQG